MPPERLESLDLDGLILYDIDDEADRNSEERRFRSCRPWTRPTSWKEPRAGARPSWSIARRRSTARKTFATGWRPRTPPSEWPSSSVLPPVRSVSPRRSAGPSSSAPRSTPICSSAPCDTRAAHPQRRRAPSAGRQARGRLLLLRHPDRLRRQRCQESGIRLRLRVPRSRPRSGPDRVHLLGVRLDKTLRVPPLARRRRPSLDRNDLRHANDTLDASLDQAEATALELITFCRHLSVPFGINVESVSVRKVEIEASVRLAERLRDKRPLTRSHAQELRATGEPKRVPWGACGTTPPAIRHAQGRREAPRPNPTAGPARAQRPGRRAASCVSQAASPTRDRQRTPNETRRRQAGRRRRRRGSSGRRIGTAAQA